MDDTKLRKLELLEPYVSSILNSEVYLVYHLPQKLCLVKVVLNSLKMYNVMCN